MRFIKYEVALTILSQINSNILQVCSTQEQKEFQLIKFQEAISKLSEESFDCPITKTKLVARNHIPWMIMDLFANMNTAEKFKLK